MRRVFVFFGGAIVVGGGLFAAACGTDNGGSSSGTLPTVDAAKDNNSSNTPPGSEDGDIPDGGTDSGPAADCSKAPKLHDNSGNFFCPFQAFLADGGSAPGCSIDELCCSPGIPDGGDGGFPPAFCATTTKDGADPGQNVSPNSRDAVCAAAAAAHNSNWEPNNHFNSEWECADSTNCPAGQVCCAVNNPDDMAATPPNKANIGANQDTEDIPKACGAKQLFRSTGTKCITGTACPANETKVGKLCGLKDTACPAGTTCQPFAGSAGKTNSTRDLGSCELP
jgi:hypothetical protein